MSSQLVALSQLISQSVAQLDQICKANDLVFPHLDEPYTSETEAYRTNQAAADAANIIAAAAFQLAATVLPTTESISNITFSPFKSASLRVCLEAFVPEILREAGPNGLHVDEIAAKSNIDSMKLGRMLRHLATHHVFREVRPDVFANNKISGMLDTGKAVKDLIANPESKHDDASGIAAVSEWILDEGHKASAFAWETMKDPTTAFSGEANETPFNRAYNVNSSLWTWYDKPENSYRLRRFNLAMQGASQTKPPDAASLHVVDWKSLPKDSLVVDVGGGVGASCLPLARDYPHIKLVIQDRPAVIEKGIPVWKAKMPGALESGRVTFQAHDFFAQQPIKNASVFLLRHIMHDWSDPYASKILSSLRKAATPETKLLVIDSIIAHACYDPKSEAIPGAAPRKAPKPLLPNYGAVNAISYDFDIAMFCYFNAQERTITHLERLLESTGWRINRVHRLDGTSTFLHPVEAVPII